MTQSGLSGLGQSGACNFCEQVWDDLARYACNTLSQGPYADYKQKVQSDGGI